MSTVQVQVNPLVVRMSEEEMREAMEALQGVCLACGELADACEPEARAYECEVCETLTVYGIEAALMMGHLAVARVQSTPRQTTAPVERNWSLKMHMNSGADFSVELVSDQKRFVAKIRDYQRKPEVFIDIETADWRTHTPRVALLQVMAGREVTVFDVLAPGMTQVLTEHFIPDVMANERIRKWAHNASFEKRFLGDARVQNLECTLRMAKGIAFHRLPIETVSLAELSGTLFGVTLDKTLQKADWAIRPLSQKHIKYAAEDTVYCSRVRTALEAIDKPPRPEDDDPESIDEAFSDAKLRERNAYAQLEAIRESVRGLMMRENVRRFSRFVSSNSEQLEVPLRLLVPELACVNPARVLEFPLRVTKEMVELFDGPHERLYAGCRATQSLQVHAPRLQRARGESPSYDVTREDADRVTRDYESRTRTHRIASSLVDELKQRMRAVLELRGMSAYRA